MDETREVEVICATSLGNHSLGIEHNATSRTPHYRVISKTPYRERRAYPFGDVGVFSRMHGERFVSHVGIDVVSKFVRGWRARRRVNVGHPPSGHPPFRPLLAPPLKCLHRYFRAQPLHQFCSNHHKIFRIVYLPYNGSVYRRRP